MLYSHDQGPVVQSLVSLMSLLVVKMLTVLVSTISNSQVFLLKKVSSFCKWKSYSHFFSKNISIYAILNDQSFNDMLTNDIISFEQLGPEFHLHQDSNPGPCEPKSGVPTIWPTRCFKPSDTQFQKNNLCSQ